MLQRDHKESDLGLTVGPASAPAISFIDLDTSDSVVELSVAHYFTRIDKITNEKLRQFIIEGGIADAFELGISLRLEGFCAEPRSLRVIVEDAVVHPISGDQKDRVIASYDGEGTFTLSALGFMERWREDFSEVHPQVLAILGGAHEASHMLAGEGRTRNRPQSAEEYSSNEEEDLCWREALRTLKSFWPSASGQLVVNEGIYLVPDVEAP